MQISIQLPKNIKLPNIPQKNGKIIIQIERDEWEKEQVLKENVI